MKTWIVCLLLWTLAGGTSLQAGTPADESSDAANEVTPPVVREVRQGDLDLRAEFHLGKIWSKDLKPFPALEKRLLVVDLNVTNRGNAPVSLYLDEVWVHMDEEDQRMARLHAEEVAPKVYAPPNKVLPDDPHRDGAQVQVYDPQMTGGTGGVSVDFSKMKKSSVPVISLERFTLVLFTREFGTNFLKPGQAAAGLLYFHLPWEIDRLEGMQLHLHGFLGGTEEAVFALPEAPPAAKKPS
jgi:hypothetical protein